MDPDHTLLAEYFLDDDAIRQRLQREIALFGINDTEVNALYERSRRRAAAFAAANASLQTFVMFIGNSRTGHSLIGACLDAHPEMIIAHELDYIRFFEKGFSRNQILYLLHDNSRHFARVGRAWGQYSYAVPGQWQGRFTTLKVIGDKKGGGSTARFMRHPYYLNLMQRFIALPMKFFHVVRDPYDMVASNARHMSGARPLEAAIRLTRARCAANQAIARTLSDTAMLTVHYEDFVADAAQGLADICGFLGLDAPQDYLRACAGIVQVAPRRARTMIDWTPAQRAAIERMIEEFPFLARYRGDGPGQRAGASPPVRVADRAAGSEPPDPDTGSGGGI